jgi:hypothetical protein
VIDWRQFGRVSGDVPMKVRLNIQVDVKVDLAQCLQSLALIVLLIVT